MKKSEGFEAEPAPRNSPGGLRELYHSWRYLFWLIGLVLLCMLFYAEENWRGYHQWEKHKQVLSARGVSFDPAAFLPPRVPDEQNFAMTPALAPLFDFFPGTQRWRRGGAPRLLEDQITHFNQAADLVKSSRAERVNSWVGEPTDLNVWASAFSRAAELKPHRNEPLLPTNYNSKDAAKQILDDLADFNPVLDELREASSRPHSRFNLRYEEENPAAILLPHLAQLKNLCRVLQLRASAELAQGSTDEALRELELLFYLVDCIRDEPILITQLVRMAELQLALQPFGEGFGAWTPSQLQHLQERLSRFDFCADMHRALEGERILLGSGVIDYVRRSHHKLQTLSEVERFGDSENMWPAGAMFAVMPGGWLYLEKTKYDEAFEEYLLPVFDWKNQIINPEAVRRSDQAITNITQQTPAKRLVRHQFFLAMLLPALTRTCQKTAFSQTAVQTATVACAIERYRLEKGKLPSNLEALVPGYIPTLPHDIINGKPLTYRAETDNRYALYSVGWNEQDDGGVVHHSNSGEADQKEGDWVWASISQR